MPMAPSLVVMALGPLAGGINPSAPMLPVGNDGYIASFSACTEDALSSAPVDAGGGTGAAACSGVAVGALCVSDDTGGDPVELLELEDVGVPVDDTGGADV